MKFPLVSFRQSGSSTGSNSPPSSKSTSSSTMGGYSSGGHGLGGGHSGLGTFSQRANAGQNWSSPHLPHLTQLATPAKETSDAGTGYSDTWGEFRLRAAPHLVGLENRAHLSSESSDDPPPSVGVAGPAGTGEIVVSVKRAMKSYGKKGRQVLDNMNMTVHKGAM